MEGIMMRKTIACLIMALMTTALISADYVQKKDLSLSAADISRLKTDCGAGFLAIKGDKEAKSIEVKAEIVIDDMRGEKAEEYIHKNMRLTLHKEGQNARLESHFENRRSFVRAFLDRTNARINLTVTIPYDLNIDVEDGSGEIVIENVGGQILIDDGSGEIEITSVSGDVEITDGSGWVYVGNIDGNVTVDDGSGAVEIEYVKGDVEIIDAGSGRLDISHVDGKVIK
jgi:DUF4097 and DUF4098 domain-containing protein YvlB